MSSQHDTTVAKKRKHLTLEEREIIERLLKSGKTKAEIARTLCRDLSTIKREIRRGSAPQIKKNPYMSKKVDCPEFLERKEYFADVGHRVYKERRNNCGAKKKIVTCRELVEFAEGKILGEETWSPDAAIGYAVVNKMFESIFTTRTFYNWIDEGLVRVKNVDLHLKVRRRPSRKHVERKKVLGKSIDVRPQEAAERIEFGHWEGDGIVGKGQKGHLITLVERTARVGFLFNVGSRESGKIVRILDDLESRYEKHFRFIFKTITFDNGPEFASSDEMERGGRTSVYYAHPYRASERGTNENWNGLVRRFIPKGSSFEHLTEGDIARINHYINTMPRKSLNYRTPLSVWKSKLSDIISESPT